MSDKKLTDQKNTIITTEKGKAAVSQKPRISGQGRIVDPESQVDIVFVFDTTGSMDDKIEALLRTCRQFVEEAKSLNLDPHFALISFGDISVQGGGDRIELVVPLTSEIEKIKYGLSNIPRNNGFGNWGESALEAVNEAFKVSYRPKSVKVIVLITDEPALQHHLSAERVTKELSSREFIVFVIATAEQYYKDMARRTGGIWKEIGQNTDLSEILELFREMAKQVSKIAKEVHFLAEGSVKNYLALKPPENT